MGMIPQEIIDQVLDGVDIAEVISEFVHLKKAGRNFKANCPFHNEKTPSFVVSHDKQIFHCFGCGAGGNAIGFLMKYEGIDFPEAVRILAARAGVVVPNTGYSKDDKSDSIYAKISEINSIAAERYHEVLKGPAGKKAMQYLVSRGLTPETIDTFKIGYAPDEWEFMRGYLEGKKFTPDLILKAGISVQGERGKGDYDRFRDRITFPIFNERGSVIAFGARTMGDSSAKYINSPETPVYSKSNVLYGLNFSKKFIRDAGTAVVVEGYMDMILPFQCGVKNVVASSGTAFTERQASSLKKYTDTVVILFDGDQAGISASLRGLEILISAGMNVLIASLPGGEDPDTFVRKSGVQGFDLLIKNAKDIFDYKLNILTNKYPQMDARGKAAIASEMLPTLAKVTNAVTQSVYIKKLAERLGVPEQAVRQEMSKIKGERIFEDVQDGKKNNVLTKPNSQLHLLGLAMAAKDDFDRLGKEVGFDKFSDPDVKKVLRALDELYRSGDAMNPGKLFGRIESDEGAKSAAVRALATVEITDADDKEKVYRDCVLRLKKEYIGGQMELLREGLKKAEQTSDKSTVKDILVKISQLHKEMICER